MELSLSETEFIELIRGKDAENFTVTVICLDGVWTVRTATFGSPTIGVGSGRSFDKAWQNIVDPKLT